MIMAKSLQSSMSFAHLNVGTLLTGNKFEMLKLQIENSEMDIFSMSESWLTEAIPDGQVEFRGYSSFKLDRKWNDNGDPGYCKRGGGLICYIKNVIPACGSKYSHLNCSTKNLEMQCILIKIKNLRDIVILNVYRPPQGDYKSTCKTMNESIAKANLKDNVEIFLMGDFNIDLKNKSSPEAKELLFVTGSNGLSQQIKGITRLNYRDGVPIGSCIDHIYTNSALIMEQQILDWNISDHLIVYVKRKKTRVHYSKVSFNGRSYRNFVKEDFQWELIDSDWDSFYQSRDPNECWAIMEGKIKLILD